MDEILTGTTNDFTKAIKTNNFFKVENTDEDDNEIEES